MGIEEIAPIVLFVLLVAGILYFVLRPLGSAAQRARARREGQRTRLFEEKAVLVQLLRDLEFDRKTGKLSEEDFATARAEAESRALAVLQELDGLDAAWTPERIEQEIEAARASLESGGRRA